MLVSVKALLLTRRPLTLGAVANSSMTDWGERYGVEVAHRWVGSILRRLGIQPQKSNGVYAIPTSEYPRLRDLFAQYQLGDVGDIGDVESSPSQH